MNPQALVDGMDNFIKEFRKISKPVRQLPVGLVIELFMKQFKNSVPLFVELKNEALRERHWRTLMDKTGMLLKTLWHYSIIAYYILNLEIKYTPSNHIIGTLLRSEKVDFFLLSSDVSF